jgi:hypothetical protein
MKTKELPLYGIQANMLGVVIENETCCKVLLVNGSHLLIECDNGNEAQDIKTTLLYYPVNGNTNNAHEFDFDFVLNYK